MVTKQYKYGQTHANFIFLSYSPYTFQQTMLYAFDIGVEAFDLNMATEATGLKKRKVQILLAVTGGELPIHCKDTVRLVIRRFHKVEYLRIVTTVILCRY